ncbi:MAG: DUF3052 domain-containing protein [Actinomycetota bacterium]
MPGDKDYSGVPLWKKLGVNDGSTFALIRKPTDVTIDVPPGTDIRTRPSVDIDVIVVFETKLAGLVKAFPGLKTKLAPGAGLWVAYPKKTSRITTDLTFENVQRTGLDAGLVDNKSCAIDGNWSGVRFVYRLKDRSPG